MLLEKKLFHVGKEKDGGVVNKFETEPEDEGTSAVIKEGDLLTKAFTVSQIIAELIGGRDSIMFELIQPHSSSDNATALGTL